MNRHILLAITAISTLALSSGCIIKESSSSGGGGFGGSTSSSGGNGGSAGEGGSGGAAGVGGAGGGGNGGAGGNHCYTCSEFFYGNVPDNITADDFCPGSAKKAQALSECACGTDGTGGAGGAMAGACGTECTASCTGMGMNGANMACENCLSAGVCSGAFSSCTADVQ